MLKAAAVSSPANIDIQIEGNGRTQSNAQINQIAASIKEFGWTNPILADADGRTGTGRRTLEGIEMKMDKRLDRLEGKFISEPTLLVMADGRVETIAGPNGHMPALFGVAIGGGSATPKQAADLALIKECKFVSEPGGARIVELFQWFYAGPVEHAAANPITP